MRYFRYKHTDKIFSAAWKAEFRQLTENEQKILQKNQVLDTVVAVVILAIMAVCFAGGVLLVMQIPEPEHWLTWVLYYMMIAALVLLGLPLSFAVGYFVAKPIINRITAHPMVLRQEAQHQACQPLREFYGLQDPFIVTKCFDCTNEMFKNHDVCIFVCKDELRITTDIQRGFAHGEKDLGCYAFRADEITLTKQDREGHLALELRTDKVTFLLGYRAKSYIEKFFLSR